MGACTSTGEQKYKFDGMDMVGAQRHPYGAINGRTPTVDGYKLVMLGMPRSGKSTLHQQMKCVFGRGFSPHELTLARTRMLTHIIHIARALCWHADRRRVDTPSVSSSIRRSIMRLTEASEESVTPTIISNDVVDHIRTLWNEPAIQLLYHQRATLYAEVGDTHTLAVIPDSCAYFMNKLTQVSASLIKPLHPLIRQSSIHLISSLLDFHLCRLPNPITR
jgi:hypothetical protein